MYEVISILAAIFEFAAIYLIGSKNRFGFLVGLVCNALWIFYVLATGHTYGLLIVASGAAILNVRGWKLWKM